MALFGCNFKVPGYTTAPDAFKDSMNRGSFIKATAFVAIHDHGHVYIVQEYASGTTEQAAKDKVLKQLKPYGTFGKFFPEAFNGTGLKSLPLLKFAHHDKATAPHYTDAEIITNKGAQLQSNAIVANPAPQVQNLDHHYTTLGLQPGASRAEVDAAWKDAAKRFHPDKGGTAQQFVAAHDAHQALTGSIVTAVVTETPPKALTYEASPAALLEQRREAFEAVQVLKEKLKAAEAHLDQVTKTWLSKDGDVRKDTRRAEAQWFVEKNFKRSAAYWDPVELRRWFRVHQGNIPNCGHTDPEFQKWAGEMKELGDDLRKGNEDLDPVVKFMAWHPGRWVGDTVLRLKVGMDLEDAVDNGIQLDMRLHVYCDAHTTPGKKLLAMGFPVDDLAWLYARTKGCWCTTFDFSFERAQEAEKKKLEHATFEAERKKRKRKQTSPERPYVMDPEVAEMLQQRRQHGNGNEDWNAMTNQVRRFRDEGLLPPRR